MSALCAREREREAGWDSYMIRSASCRRTPHPDRGPTSSRRGVRGRCSQWPWRDPGAAPAPALRAGRPGCLRSEGGGTGCGTGAAPAARNLCSAGRRRLCAHFPFPHVHYHHHTSQTLIATTQFLSLAWYTTSNNNQYCVVENTQSKYQTRGISKMQWFGTE